MCEEDDDDDCADQIVIAARSSFHPLFKKKNRKPPSPCPLPLFFLSFDIYVTHLFPFLLSFVPRITFPLRTHSTLCERRKRRSSRTLGDAELLSEDRLKPDKAVRRDTPAPCREPTFPLPPRKKNF